MGGVLRCRPQAGLCRLGPGAGGGAARRCVPSAAAAQELRCHSGGRRDPQPQLGAWGGRGVVCSQLGMGSKQRLLLAAVGLSFDFYPLMEGRLQGESGV